MLLAIGGWNDSAGSKYSELVNNPSARANFVGHVVDFLRRNDFDGLDFDWEYPKCWQVRLAFRRPFGTVVFPSEQCTDVPCRRAPDDHAVEGGTLTMHRPSAHFFSVYVFRRILMPSFRFDRNNPVCSIIVRHFPHASPNPGPSGPRCEKHFRSLLHYFITKMLSGGGEI